MAKKRVTKRQPPIVADEDVQEIVDILLSAVGDPSDYSDEGIVDIAGGVARFRDYGKWTPAYHRELVRKVRSRVAWMRFRDKNRPSTT